MVANFVSLPPRLSMLEEGSEGGPRAGDPGPGALPRQREGVTMKQSQRRLWLVLVRVEIAAAVIYYVSQDLHLLTVLVE